DGLPSTEETLRRKFDLTECYARKVFTRGCPAVIEKHCALGVEGWGDGLFPTGTQLSFNGLEQGVVGLRGLWCFFDQTQLRQNLACSRSQHTVFSGDSVCISVECCGVNNSTAARSARSTHGHRSAVSCCDSLNCGIDKRIYVRLRGSRGWNCREGAAAHGVLFAGAQQDFSFNVSSP